MKKKILLSVLAVIIVVLAYFTYVFAEYIHRQNENKKMIEYCSQNDTKECYDRMFELMLPELLLYDVWVDNKKVELIRTSEMLPILDSFFALKNSYALLGYGVFNTTAYEESYSRLFDKNSYAFDCGVSSHKPNHEKCSFYSECIGSDKFIIFDVFTKQMQTSSGLVHNLEEKLIELNLKDKSVFVKVDVGYADTVAMTEIVKNSKNIIGFNLALYLTTPDMIIERIPHLKKINKDFLLVSRNLPYANTNDQYEIINSKYYNDEMSSRSFYLSYINKNFVQEYSMLFDQNTSRYINDSKTINLLNPNIFPANNISYIVPLFKKLGYTFDVDEE